DSSESRTAPALREAARIASAGWERVTPDRSARRRAPSRPVAMRASRANAWSTRARSSRRVISPEVRVQLRAHDPHREVLRGAAVRMTEGDRCAVDLVVAGGAAHLVGGLEAADETRCADRVRREHAARRVHREAPRELRLPRVGQLPPLALRGDEVPFDPPGLVPLALD